ncbi:hypothetical protein NLI96_g12624 [Meripilus lineatus]|uniref:Uncharacterized protein n=1 Tax=Meripilus lineatus TaxID=2056292 RepID=A0AAD5Y7E5_9APHY|nr:hypothetical protein NLI96_g12624 [Physisporinus lineatus]
MTIGNILKATRRRPSRYMWILVAYLPTAKLKNLDLTELEGKVTRDRLFHKCMREIVQPLIGAGSALSLVPGQGSSLNQADIALKPLGLNPIAEPFWKDLPHCNIHKSIGSDILHQGYQGVLKTLIEWLQKIVGDLELDAQFKCLPFMHGVRSFAEGISGLSHITSGQHKNICKQILGCIVGVAPNEAVRATMALLDFFYLVQYHTHNEDSLKAMEKALDEFHANKEISVTTEARDVKGKRSVHLALVD